MVDMLRNFCAFLMIAGTAVAMSLLVQTLSSVAVDAIIIGVLRILDYLIFVADALWFARYLVSSITGQIVRSIREMLPGSDTRKRDSS